KAYDLVHDAECITHTTFALLSNDLECCFISVYIFFIADILEMLHRICRSDPFKVEDLATAEDGGKDLMFFGGSQNKNGKGRGFFKCLQKGIEGSRAQHVYLIYDIHFVFAGLWIESHLLHERTDIIH